jgi:tRNA threonylcarbamoyladenosine biosynthesis protein TsaE
MIPVVTTNPAQTEALGSGIGELLRPGDVVVLTGDLGTGKTTFVKGAARGLGVSEPVTSPTFAIVQEYDGRYPVAHVDVYRLVRIQELHDFGFEELLEERIVLIEWGESIARVLPADRLEVRFAVPDDAETERTIELVPHGAAWSTRKSHLVDVVNGLR